VTQQAAKRRTAAIVSGGIITLTLIGLLAARGLAQSGGGSGSLPRIGEYTVSNEGGKYNALLSSNTIRATLTGPNLSITSRSYDMAARRIDITVRKSAAASRYNNSRVVADGNVRVVVRQPEAQRVNTVTCNNATYDSATAPPVRGRIDFRGNVRWVIRDPGLAGPAVQTAKSGYIEFLPGNETRVSLDDGTFRATPIEPAPRSRPRR
jgi:hypothetical protein